MLPLEYLNNKNTFTFFPALTAKDLQLLR